MRSISDCVTSSALLSAFARPKAAENSLVFVLIAGQLRIDVLAFGNGLIQKRPVQFHNRFFFGPLGVQGQALLRFACAKSNLFVQLSSVNQPSDV